jgi:hypothetical protein
VTWIERHGFGELQSISPGIVRVEASDISKCLIPDTGRPLLFQRSEDCFDITHTEGRMCSGSRPERLFNAE